MPLVLRLKPFESSKGFDGAAVGWEATPLRVVTVTGLSCKGRSPRSVDRGGLEARGGAMRERSRCAPPYPAPSRQPGPGGKGKGKPETPPSPAHGARGLLRPHVTQVCVWGCLEDRRAPPAWLPQHWASQGDRGCVCMARAPPRGQWSGLAGIATSLWQALRGIQHTHPRGVP